MESCVNVFNANISDLNTINKVYSFDGSSLWNPCLSKANLKLNQTTNNPTNLNEYSVSIDYFDVIINLPSRIIP